MMHDTFHIHIDDEGHLRIDGYDGFVEPICATCGKAIPWVLDMMSFTYDKGGFIASHAACVWTKRAFTKQRKRASKHIGEDA